LNNHMKARHPEEYQADIDRLVDPNVHFTPPPAPVGTVPDGYDRIMVELLRPLTSLETRLMTSNNVEEEDYDSPDEADGTGMDLDELDPSMAAQHLVEFPGEIIVIGVDEGNRKDCLDLTTLWRPCRSGYEFKLARWMMDANLSKQSIDRFFNEGLARIPPPNADGSEGTCYTSAYTFCNLLDNLDSALNIHSWKPMAVDHVGTGLIEFRYRSVEAMIRHIFKQPSHAPYMIYKPIQEFDGVEKKYKLLSDLHTGAWWWRAQVFEALLGGVAFLTDWCRSYYLRDTLSFPSFLAPTKPSRRTSLVTRTSGR
jgi:hypothetical protein